MLIGKGPAILGMTLQAKLIDVRRPQIVSGRAAMRIVTIRAAHLSFAQRVMVRQAHFTALRLVTFQASIVGLPPWLYECFRFRYKVLDVGDPSGSRHVDESVRSDSVLGVGVRLMTIDAANPVGGMGASHPVAEFLITCVAAKANAISLHSRTLAERNDLSNVSAAIHVQAARAVTLLALYALLRVKGMPEILSDVRVAGGAGFGANRFRSWDFDKLCEGCDAKLGLLSCVG